MTEAWQGRLWSSPGVVTNTAGSKWASSFVINHPYHERGSYVKDRQTKRKVFADQFVRSCRMMIGKQLQCHAVSWLALMRTFCYSSCLFAPWRHAASNICTFKPNVTSCFFIHFTFSALAKRVKLPARFFQAEFTCSVRACLQLPRCRGYERGRVRPCPLWVSFWGSEKNLSIWHIKCDMTQQDGGSATDEFGVSIWKQRR